MIGKRQVGSFVLVRDDRDRPFPLSSRQRAPGDPFFSLADSRLNATVSALFFFADPIVQRPRTPPFHGGNTGSNPVRVENRQQNSLDKGLTSKSTAQKMANV